MNVINRAKAIEVINETQGGFFSVVFTKKDGSTRKMTCRKGVYHKDLKGVGSTVARPDTPYVTVWDVVKHAYRVLNLETLQAITTRGMVYIVSDYNKKERTHK